MGGITPKYYSVGQYWMKIWVVINYKESKDRRGCTILIAKVAALNLGTMASICFFHDSELSRVKPRNFIPSTVVSFLSLYIMSNLLLGLFFVVKCIKWIFFQFKDIKLALNHSCIYWRILLASSLNFIGSGFEIIRLVSSANKTILLFLFIECGKSFIYKRKSKGPSIEPWGTPWVPSPQSEM